MINAMAMDVMFWGTKQGATDPVWARMEVKSESKLVQAQQERQNH